MKLELIDSRHIQLLLRIAADKRIAQTSGVPENYTGQDIAEWIRRSLQVPFEEMHFVLIANDKVLGSTAARLMAAAAFDILGMKALNSHYLKYCYPALLHQRIKRIMNIITTASLIMCM